MSPADIRVAQHLDTSTPGPSQLSRTSRAALPVPGRAWTHRQGAGQACHTHQLPEPRPGKHGSGRERAGRCRIPWRDARPRGPTLALFFSTSDNCPSPRPCLCRTPSFSCVIPSLKPHTSPKDRAVTSVTYKGIGALSGGCLSCPSTRPPHDPRRENTLPNRPHACPSSPPPRPATHSRLVTGRRALASPPPSALIDTVKSL